MSQVEAKAVNNDTKIERIINYLHSLDYSDEDFKDFISLPLAQWLHDEGFSLEDTGLIITSIVNVAESDLKDIFDDNTFSLYDKSELASFLKQNEYEELEKIIKPIEKINSYSFHINDDESIKVDFLNKKVFYLREYQTAKGETNTKEIPVIEAVPYELIVYDSDFIGSTRNFKITWKSKYSQRLFVTEGENGGATIKDIELMIANAGYTHNKKLLSDVLSTLINSMIDKGLAITKSTIDNKGVYYSDGKLLIVKLDVTNPSAEQVKSALKQLEELHKYYKSESAVLATVLKWSMVSVFSYARKQAGANWFPWLYLVGTGQSGKTTLGKIGSFFYGVPNDEMNIGGASFNSDYRIGLHVSRDCCMTIVNEPKATFKNENTIETTKNSVELKVCRVVQGKIYPAFSPVLFTANSFIPEMDSLYRRLFIIEFNYNQRKTGEIKTEFEKKFSIENPSKSCLTELQVLGRVALRAVMANPNLLSDDWKDFADKLLLECYTKAGYKSVPEWLQQWSKDKELEDLDNVIIEEIQAILSKELYNASKRYSSSNYNPDDKTSSKSKEFKPLIWDLVNNKRAFNWALPHQPWGKERSIFLTQGFKRLLQDDIEEIGSLKSIAQLLGWEYKKIRFEGQQKRGILVSFDVFMKFAYPSVE